ENDPGSVIIGKNTILLVGTCRYKSKYMEMLTCRLNRLTLLLLIGFILPTVSYAQGQEFNVDSLKNKRVVVTKYDGASFTGVIKSADDREILIDAEGRGRMYIPLHVIRSIREISINQKDGYSMFSTRYFLTTNGLGMTKGDKYALLNYYGPEAQFAVADDFTLGVMTTWAAIPLIGSAKYSIHFDDNFHMSLGTLVGTLSWIKLDAAGILGYGAFTIGNYENNFTISAGYAGVTYDGEGGSAPLLSLACLFRLGSNLYFVGDSFIYLGETPFTVIVPGLRFERPFKRSSIQVGIGGIVADGEAIPVPLPLFSWFFDLQ
ncbi:MAG: hypothetical protein V2I34_03705, partial [Bacteroidales bacterium]|nr:hypothetical protein [Bacteroidales bacterium]